MAETHCCVFTRGEFYIRDAAPCGSLPALVCEGQGPFKKIGNVSSAIVDISGTVLGKENEFNPADPESRIEIQGVNLSITMNCASSKNLLQALYGATEESDSGSHILDFCFTSLSSDDFFPFEFKGVDQETVVVYLRNSGGVVSTLVLGTDYLVNSSGVQIISDSIDPLDSTTIRLAYSYDTASFNGIEFQSLFPKYKEIYFKGTNYGDDELSMFDAKFYRVLFAPLNTFDLITRDEFFTISLVGSVEKHQSKWFKITKQE